MPTPSEIDLTDRMARPLSPPTIGQENGKVEPFKSQGAAQTTRGNIPWQPAQTVGRQFTTR